MFTFLLVVHAIIAAALVGVILMQRSEGGGLGMGGSPAGLMSARGAADFLTRSTSILATLFVGFSILLAFLAAMRHSQTVDTSLARQPVAPSGSGLAAPAQTPGAPSAAAIAAAAAEGNAAAPVGNSTVPIER